MTTANHVMLSSTYKEKEETFHSATIKMQFPRIIAKLGQRAVRGAGVGRTPLRLVLTPHKRNTFF